MPQRRSKKKKQGKILALTKNTTNKSNLDLAEYVAKDALQCYPVNNPLKPHQIKAVIHLARLQNTSFVMAGTDFGKSRISEMYVHLFEKSKNPVVLVLNPLDALGNKQVQEKIQQGYTAVNLKKPTFNPKVANQILHGSYTFVDLSPEVYLNNKLFTKIYYDTKFQECLFLNVVDKAHMIYIWVLVASGKAKNSKAHKRHQDRTLLRPL
ncbi:hypothetical protein PCASD_08706 [Puccinia coronata f. sp. avenae]|uniref:Helicase ATP-binding domain-containing protein n=1 Tax=Puccinia coronata f. sp. avenae TaxID=200324 RepID=A0A2N5UG31_9BASI|nr:hypothetical protein PCASD_08706 [Puccinia coronata f. sp. avenae]